MPLPDAEQPTVASDGTSVGRHLVEQPSPWPFSSSGSVLPRQPVVHRAGRCGCKERHTPLEATQLNAAVYLPETPPGRAYTGDPGLHNACRQQDLTGWLQRQQQAPGATDVRGLLGAEHWAPEQQPDEAAPQVCAWRKCSKPLEMSGRQGTAHKRYCCASHRVRASEERKRAQRG